LAPPGTPQSKSASLDDCVHLLHMTADGIARWKSGMHALTASAEAKVKANPPVVSEMAIRMARRAGNGSVVAWLLTEQGLPPSNKDADGLTPLHHAVLAHSAVAVASLLAAGASTTALDSAGATPLALAQHLNDRICVPETQHVLEELGAPGGPKSG
jgi:ankyrin repeat protein